MLLSVCPGAYGVTYAVKGSLVYESLLPGRSDPALSWHFEAVCDGCRWKITATPDKPTGFKVFVDQYDGTNLLSYAESERIPESRSGTIEVCEVPRMWTSSGSPFVWMAYASSSYLDRVTNGRATSIFEARAKTGVVRRFEVPLQITRYQSPPYLPIRLRYIQEGFPSITKSGAVETIPLSGIYPGITNAFIEGELQSGEFTNINGFAVPRVFTYRRFRPAHVANSAGDLRCILTVRGLASEITVTDVQLDLALGAGSSFLQDLRVPEPNTLLRVTNGIPTTNSPEVLKARQKAEKMARFVAAVPPHSALKRWLVRTLVAIAFCLPLFVLVTRYKGTFGKKKRTTITQ
jgi:hypothetical protein